jgi:hypothetical protein
LLIKCDFSHEQINVIEIRKDDTTGKYGIYNNESKTFVLPHEYDSISHRKGKDYSQGDWEEQNSFTWEEEPTYERYGGSYAQDEMGFSDDEIDTIFDGDPSAYWNID